jgi:hypothetical protein
VSSLEGLPAWPDVLAAALVGTDRRPLAVPASTSDDPATALLDAAGVLTLYRRAGASQATGLTLPPPSPVDSAPLVPPKSVARLGDLVADDPGRSAWQSSPIRDAQARTEILAEWLIAVAELGKRVPGEALPALLETGRRHRALRPLIAAAGGARAGWLAAQHSDWAYLVTETTETLADDDQAWEFGTIGQRVGYLVAARRRDPAAARARLLRTWDTEGVEDRAALLAALATGLSTDDEQLLERALDDRRKEVRIAAVELLAQLPDSAYARRMVERVSACVTLAEQAGSLDASRPRPGQLAGNRIGIDPPSTCDKGMRRDGINPRPPAGVGERAWWLEELLTRAPLRIWGEPAAFLRRQVPEGWSPVLRRGLARAAAAQRDATWAAALTEQLTEEVTAGGRPDDRLLLESLYDVLPARELTALAIPALHRGLASAAAIGVERVLELCPRPWPEALADAVFSALDDFTGRRGAGWRLAGLCELAALRLPAGDAGRAESLANAIRAQRPDDPTVQIVQRFADTLRFRHDMLKELT